MWTEGKKIHESYYDGERKAILKKNESTRKIKIYIWPWPHVSKYNTLLVIFKVNWLEMGQFQIINQLGITMYIWILITYKTNYYIK